MNHEQAKNLAHELAINLASDLGNDEYLVHKQDDGDPSPTVFWVLRRDLIDAENLDCLDLDEDSTYFAPVQGRNRSEAWAVEENFTGGGGCIWIDKDTCFETSY